MIPATHITIDDGTAWWVLNPSKDWVEGAQTLDRPCGTCRGKGRDLATLVDPCPADCVDGRHTFDIEVLDTEAGGKGGLYRVSIVPGMVLPIVEAQTALPDSTVVVDWGNRYGGNLRFAVSPVDDDGRHITLPSAARPGMWCIQVRVAR